MEALKKERCIEIEKFSIKRLEWAIDLENRMMKVVNPKKGTMEYTPGETKCEVIRVSNIMINDVVEQIRDHEESLLYYNDELDILKGKIIKSRSKIMHIEKAIKNVEDAIGRYNKVLLLVKSKLEEVNNMA
ncbi:MAG: hypothetical protein ACRC0S_05140 [Fusobacteriaceae bacterium]